MTSKMPKANGTMIKSNVTGMMKFITIMENSLKEDHKSSQEEIGKIKQEMLNTKMVI